MFDLKGQRKGFLEVLKFHRKNSRGTSWWVRCECGKEFSMALSQWNKTENPSCGCKMYETTAKSKIRHGHSVGGKCTSEYAIYNMMKMRCYCETNKAYRLYGGRGIQMCDRWLGDKGFENFLEDMGPRPSKRHSVDRFPNKDGNYEPGNVRWATQKEQMNNVSYNRFVEAGGKVLTVSQWADEMGLTYAAVKLRLRRGWSPEESVGLARRKGCRRFPTSSGTASSSPLPSPTTPKRPSSPT